MYSKSKFEYSCLYEFHALILSVIMKKKPISFFHVAVDLVLGFVHLFIVTPEVFVEIIELPIGSLKGGESRFDRSLFCAR
jgi:hypothetical protein